MYERFDNRFVRIVQAYVFSDQSYRDFTFRIFVPAEEIEPFVHFKRIGTRQAEVFENYPVQLLLFHQDRHIVYRFGVYRFDNGGRAYITELSQFVFHFLRQMVFGAAYQHSGLHTGLHEGFYRMLRRFGLKFAGSGKIRHQRQVYHQGIVRTEFPL